MVVIPPDWGRVQRVAFRFAVVYFGLYALPFPLDSLPLLDKIPFDKAWRVFDFLIARNLFGIDGPIFDGPTGSGDTTLDYAHLVGLLLLAVIGTLAWTGLDRRLSYPRLWRWFHAYLRLYLCVIMLSYGFAKVFKTQFPTPTPGRLMERFGESSPMGLLWTFMGFSAAYTIFAGLMEVLGAALLVPRRTTTLGALVVAAVMTNVVMMNFSYDVPVKLFSSHLLLIALVIAGPDLRRLADFFLLNRATAPVDIPRAPKKLIAIKALFLGWVVFNGIKDQIDLLYTYGDLAPRVPLYGLWEVDSGAPAWERLSFNANAQFAGVYLRDGKTERYWTDVDEHSLTFGKWDARDDKAVMTIDRLDADHLVLRGTFYDQGPVTITFHHRDVSEMFLMSRGFHWINEIPINK